MILEKTTTGWMKGLTDRFRRHEFLFTELVKRDFKHKYKGTALGMLWSVLEPLLHLLVMRLVFTQFFGRNTPHYTTYLFCGNLVFTYFSQSTSSGMSAIVQNSNILSKVRAPKYLFLLSKNVSDLINFGLTLCVFFLFVVLDHVAFSWSFLTLIYPILCLIVFNIGIGMILSTIYVFFRDTSYLYSIFTLLLRYLSAIFYTVDRFPENVQKMFLLNPIYCFIRYFRIAVIDGMVPSAKLHLLCMGYAAAAALIGALLYKKNNVRFLYYM